MHGLDVRNKTLQADSAEAEAAKESELDFNIQAAMGLEGADRQKALIEAYTAYDPKVAAEMQKAYTAQEIDQIALRASEMQQSYAEAQRQGLSGIMKWYDDIPDGKKVVLQPSTKGGEGMYDVLMFDEANPDAPPEVWASHVNEANIIQKVEAHTTPGGFMKLAEHISKQAKTQAEVANLQADTSLKNRTPGLRGSGGSGGLADSRRITRLQAQQSFYGKQFDAARDELSMQREGTPGYKAALARANAIGKKLEGVEGQLERELNYGEDVGEAAGGKQEVIFDGKVIGYASSPEEAQALVAKAQGKGTSGGLKRREDGPKTLAPRGYNPETGEYEKEEQRNVFDEMARRLRGY
jgi:hypothetical protein